MKQYKLLIITIALTIASLTLSNVCYAETNGVMRQTTSKPHKLKKIKVKVTKKEMKKFFGKSAFIGNSIGLGHKMYMNSSGKKYMGHPKMLVKGCYAFTNDKGGKYSLSFKGYNGPAKKVVKKSKVKRVFINMGTNDLFEGPNKVFKRYKKYVNGIRKTNKGIVVYIESMTPVYKSGQKKRLNNKNVNKLNKKLKNYCSKRKDIYYIDISTALKDSSGGLKKKYTSDSYVHMTMDGYKVWTKKVYKYIKKQLKAEKRTKVAVKYAKKFRTSNEVNRAKKLVKELPKSTVKNKLKKKLKKVKVKQ